MRVGWSTRTRATFSTRPRRRPACPPSGGAQGIWVEELDGRRFMDFHGNSVHHLGYSHPTLIAALKAQLDDLTFSPRRFTNEVAVALARRLADLAPAPLGKVLLAPSGNDAMEIALRLARVATGRFKTVSFWDAYHGAGLARVERWRRAGVPLRSGTVRSCPAPSTSPRRRATGAPTATPSATGGRCSTCAG